MKRLASVAAVLGVAMASCSGGHGAGSMLPTSTGAGGNSPLGAARSSVAGQSAAPAGWSNTATQAMNLNAPDAGAIAPSQTLTVRLGLAVRNVNGLKAVVASGQILSPAQITASYAPTSADVAKVTAYLQSEGFSSITAEGDNLLVSATGTAAQVSKAFNTTLHNYTLGGARVFANVSPAYVPTALGGTVVAVLGLNSVQGRTGPKNGPAQRAKQPAPSATPTPQPESPCQVTTVNGPAAAGASTTACLRSYTPSDYWRAYDALTSPAATGVSVGIITEGNVTQAISDFRVNEANDSLVQVPVIVRRVGLASPDTAGNDEWTLDMLASSGMARALKSIYLYDTTSLTDNDVALAINKFVANDEAKVGNASLGICEAFPYLDGSMMVDDMALNIGAAQGQTLFASTGDNGGFCGAGVPNGVPGGAPLVEYPATSTYAAAVGGTTLLTKLDGSYQGEATWYGGGGGISQFEASPFWEAGIQPVSSAGGFTFRGDPDIAMDADPNTGMAIYVTGFGNTTIGGTSLASPLAAGVWARILQSHGALGFAPLRLYRSFAATTSGTADPGLPPTIPHGGFHDIVTGSNVSYQATPNFDYTTGLGTLDVDLLNANVMR